MFRCFVLIFVAWTFTAVHAQEYPSRGLKIVVPFGPGTGSDALARTIGAKVAQSLGQPVSVENREGAGGVIGARAVLAAPADGYTLLLAANPFVAGPLLYEQPPYDPLKDFVAVAKVASVPNVLLVNNAVAAKTVKELIARAKQSPGKLNYASSGKGTPSQLETELFKSMYDLDIVEVPYKSTAQAMTDVIGGQVSVYYPTLAAGLPHIKSGRVRALAVGGVHRSPAAPDVPTMAEALGAPDYEAQTWYGFVVAAGTPSAIVATLKAEIARAVQTPEVKERIAGQGGALTDGGPEDFAAQMHAEIEKWTRVVKRLRIKEGP